jgi:cell filamentation protein
MFCYPENVAREMRRTFGWLKDRGLLRSRTADAFAAGAAHFLAELNAIHPFRDGNGRAQISFVALIAAMAGHPMDRTRLQPAPFLAAMIASFHGDEGPLHEQIGQMIGLRR